MSDVTINGQKPRVLLNFYQSMPTGGTDTPWEYVFSFTRIRGWVWSASAGFSADRLEIQFTNDPAAATVYVYRHNVPANNNRDMMWDIPVMGLYARMHIAPNTTQNVGAFVYAYGVS